MGDQTGGQVSGQMGDRAAGPAGPDAAAGAGGKPDWLARTLPTLTQNWLSLIGLAIVFGTGILFITTLIVEVAGGRTNPYIGMLVYLVLPSVFAVGLVLVPIGALLQARAYRKAPPVGLPRYPVLDLGLPRHRGLVLGFAAASIVVAGVLGVASVRATAFMDTPEFCGSCHRVMSPETVAYRESPHARVACVDCHIGPGADWYVRSKLSGVGQVFAYALNTYPRPIPAPIKELRPAQETCEQCHWPEKFFGDKMVVRPHFARDEANAGTLTTFVIRTGGGSATRSSSGGIHWHMNIRNEVRYVAADRERQKIPWVELTDPSGAKTIYQDTSAPLSPAALATAEKRLMDCMDCHNRPTHIYNSPDVALDTLIDEGAIDRSIPFIKREAVAALTQPYPDAATAERSIAERLETYYKTSYPAVFAAKRGSINQAIGEVQRVYRTNFFPEMKVDWRTYPDNLKHQEGGGCFRCHDGKHVSASGQVISFSCDTCHTLPETTRLMPGQPSRGRVVFPTPAPAPTQPAPPATPTTAPAQPTAAPTTAPAPPQPTATAAAAPAGVKPAEAPSPTPAPAAPATPTAAAPAKPAAPAGGPSSIPHAVEGRQACLACHTAGALAVPASHAGRANETCVACHRPG